MRHIGGDLDKFKQVVPIEVLVGVTICDFLVDKFEITEEQARQMVSVQVKQTTLLVRAPASVRQVLYQNQESLFKAIKIQTGLKFDRLI